MQIHNRLQELRKSRGLSAADLAGLVGTTRQTIHSIEAGNFVPNTAIALQLARALDVTVDRIFSIPGEQATEPIRAELLNDATSGEFVRLCRVNGRLLAVRSSSVPAYLPPTDGIVQSASRRTVSIHSPEGTNRLLLAGCDPALSLLNELLQPAGMEILTVATSSRRALQWLKQGRVHAAGSHLLDKKAGEYNLPFIRRLFPHARVRVVTFATWEQGLVVRSGNPKSIRSIADLSRKNITLINRENGSGSRDLLDTGLREAGIDSKSVKGYDSIAPGHLAAAYAVAARTADCCIAPRSAARCFGLDFLPLAVERFDLAFTRDSLESAPAKALLDLLNRSQLRNKLQLIAGYDTAQTGQVLI
jgi:putative molybdopterin biosynthesis protein